MKHCKNILAIIVLIGIISFAINTAVFAENDEINAEYNTVAGYVEITGCFSRKINTDVTLMVLDSQMSITDVNATLLNNSFYPVRQTKCSDKGTFEFQFRMPATLKSGKYSAWVTCAGKRLKADFSYIEKNDMNNIINEINGEDASGIEKTLADNAVFLNLSDNDLKYKDDVAKYIKSDKPSGGYDTKLFSEALKRSLCVAYIKNNDEVSVTLKKYSENFNIDTSEITSDTLGNVTKYVNSEPLTNTKELLNRAVIMAGIESVKAYADFDGLINLYGENAGMDLKNYNELSSSKRTEVLKKLNDGKYSSFAEFNNAFENIVKTKKNENNQKPSSASSGNISRVPSAGNETVNKPTQNENNGFTDIDGHWAKTYIDALIGKGIMNGYGDNTVRPNGMVTRAEFIKMLFSALNGKKTSTQYFVDCTAEDWFFEYVSGAKDAGLIDGYGNTFGPNDYITRQDAATIIYRALNTTETVSTADFKDFNEISDYAQGAVGYLYSKGIVSGSDGNFNPKNNTTRAETATLIYKLLNSGELSDKDNRNIALNDKTTEAYGLVSSISDCAGYMPFSTTVPCSREMFFETLMSTLGVDKAYWTGADFSDVSSDTDLYGYVSYGVKNGVIENGGQFFPSEAIKYDDMVKFGLNAFGYEIVVKNSSYMNVAEKLHLSQGINTDDGITTAEAYRFIFNLLNVNDIEKEYSGDEYKYSNDTILFNRYRIKPITGILTANEYTMINDITAGSISTQQLKGHLSIDGVEYKAAAGVEYNDLLGCNVRAYIHTDAQSDDSEVIAIYNQKNYIVELTSYDYDYKDNYISLKDNKKKYKISKNFDAVVNGKLDPDFNLESLNKISGTVKLISNDLSKEYSILVIKDYKYVKVSTFDRQELIVREMKDKSTSLTIPDESIVSVTSTDGENVELSDIAADSYLAVAASKDMKLVSIVILNNTVDGKISSYDDEKIVINSTNYQITPYFREKYLIDLKGGVQGSYVLGLFGDIVAVTDVDSTLQYGYMASANLDDSEDDKIFLRIFSQNGDWVKTSTADGIVIDGAREKNVSELYQRLFAKPTMIKFELNDAGEVKMIDFPEDMNFFKDADQANLNSKNNFTRNFVSDENDKYYYLSGTLYPSVSMNGTIVFRIPSDRKNYDAYDLGYAFDEGYLTEDKDIAIYDVGYDGYAKVVCAFVDEQAAVYVNSPTMVVESVYDKVDDEGDVRKAVSGWSQGKFVEYYLGENVKIEKKKKADELAIGDIIRFNLRGNEIRALYVDFIGKNFMMNYINGTGLMNFNARTTNYQYRAGGVYSYENGSAFIAKLMKKNNNDAEQVIDYTYTPGNFVMVNIPDSVIKVDLANKKLIVSDKNAIQTYLNSENPSKVVVNTYRGNGQYCVIYEGSEE